MSILRFVGLLAVAYWFGAVSGALELDPFITFAGFAGLWCLYDRDEKKADA